MSDMRATATPFPVTHVLAPGGDVDYRMKHVVVGLRVAQLYPCSAPPLMGHPGWGPVLAIEHYDGDQVVTDGGTLTRAGFRLDAGVDLGSIDITDWAIYQASRAGWPKMPDYSYQSSVDDAHAVDPQWIGLRRRQICEQRRLWVTFINEFQPGGGLTVKGWDMQHDFESAWATYREALDALQAAERAAFVNAYR